MIRIEAGEFRSRRLQGPRRDDRSLRPTSGRVKQILFDLLGPLTGVSHVLDLFAGAGTLGFEALSRGVARATFVDANTRAAALLRRNAAVLGVEERVRIVKREVLAFLGDPAEEWPLVLADPPYAAKELETLLQCATESVTPGGRIVIEHATDVEFDSAGFEPVRRRVIGGTTLSIFRRPAAADQEYESR